MIQKLVAAISPNTGSTTSADLKQSVLQVGLAALKFFEIGVIQRNASHD
jgi:hypothetical protein